MYNPVSYTHLKLGSRDYNQNKKDGYLVAIPCQEYTINGETYTAIGTVYEMCIRDRNELFSFREELTEKEIGQFVNGLSEVSLDSFTEAFEMASRKIQEYPH